MSPFISLESKLCHDFQNVNSNDYCLSNIKLLETTLQLAYNKHFIEIEPQNAYIVMLFFCIFSNLCYYSASVA